METKTEKQNITISITKEAKKIGKQESNKIGLSFSGLIEQLLRSLKK